MNTETKKLTLAEQVAEMWRQAMHPGKKAKEIPLIKKSRPLSEILFPDGRKEKSSGVRPLTEGEGIIDGLIHPDGFLLRRKESQRSAALRSALAGDLQRLNDAFMRESRKMITSGGAFDGRNSFERLCQKFQDDAVALIGNG